MRFIREMFTLTPFALPFVKKTIFCILALYPMVGFSSAFEEMLSGFRQCQFKDVYVDLFTKKPVHPFLLERKL